MTSSGRFAIPLRPQLLQFTITAYTNSYTTHRLHFLTSSITFPICAPNTTYCHFTLTAFTTSFKSLYSRVSESNSWTAALLHLPLFRQNRKPPHYEFYLFADISLQHLFLLHIPIFLFGLCHLMKQKPHTSTQVNQAAIAHHHHQRSPLHHLHASISINNPLTCQTVRNRSTILLLSHYFDCMSSVACHSFTPSHSNTTTITSYTANT